MRTRTEELARSPAAPHSVEASVVIAVARYIGDEIERVAERVARKVLQDPEFRRQLRASRSGVPGGDDHN